jgi:hypothetical protein
MVSGQMNVPSLTISSWPVAARSTACIHWAGAAYKQQINHHEKDRATMKFYWDLNSIPELQGLPREQQRQLWQAGSAVHRSRIVRDYALMAVGVVLAVMLPGLLLGIMLPTFGGIPGSWVGLCVFSGIVIAQHLRIATIRPWLAAQRAAVDPNPARGDM